MARDYARVHEFYLQLHDMQPPAHHYQHYGMQAGASAAPAYEVTPGAEPGQPHHHASHHHHHHHHSPHHQRKKKTQHFADGFEMSPCSEMTGPAPPEPMLRAPVCAPRKRKLSSYGTGSTYEDDGDDARSTRTLPDKKQNHSEIEKRRRDKMNTYICELSAMVPMCGAMARKLDKLTVLRMAVQHVRSVRGVLAAGPLALPPRPTFLSQRELNALVLHAASDACLLVVGCDRGRLLYVSASVAKMLHYDQPDLLGQSLFDILHPKDVAKVKEQLSSSDLSPRERLIDAKTMLPVKADVMAGASRLCTGARRSFFCRIKCKVTPEAPPVKEEADAKLRKKHEKKYCVVQCTGYLKSWAPAEMSERGSTTEGNEEGEACSLSCLVAVGRALPDLLPTPSPCPPTLPTRHLQYVSRHATDGKFLFVDQRVTLALGYLPQELLGTSLYEYVSGPELGAVARTHKAALVQRDALHTPPYAFRRKDGTLARIQTHFKPFRNPWTKDVECLVAKNTVLEEHSSPPEDATLASYEIYKQKADVEMQRLIDSQVESHKIGSAIAEEALRSASADVSPDLPADLLQDVVFNQQASLVDNILGAELSAYPQIRNNVPLSVAGAASPPDYGLTAGPSPPAASPLPLDGNGEAAMAVIMSLLEADAGLGGPVNFSGLPWPLP